MSSVIKIVRAEEICLNKTREKYQVPSSGCNPCHEVRTLKAELNATEQTNTRSKFQKKTAARNAVDGNRVNGSYSDCQRTFIQNTRIIII